MWTVSLNFNGRWVRLPGHWVSRDAAEWSVAKWKMLHDMQGDPFLYRDEAETEEDEKAEEFGDPVAKTPVESVPLVRGVPLREVVA